MEGEEDRKCEREGGKGRKMIGGHTGTQKHRSENVEGGRVDRNVGNKETK